MLFVRHINAFAENGCWEWTGSRYKNGYGSFNIGDAPIGAHRASFQFFNGPIKTGNVVMHACDNKLCVNPNHLLQGTQRDNMQDMLAKGRGAVSEKHYTSKLSREDVNTIRESEKKYEELASEFDVSANYIYQIKSFQRRKHD